MTTPRYKNREWGEKGARIRKIGTRRVVPLENLLEEREKLEKELVELPNDLRNERKAHCKLCGAILLPGEGTPFQILSSNGYNRSKYYACEVCYSKLKEYLI